MHSPVSFWSLSRWLRAEYVYPALLLLWGTVLALLLPPNQAPDEASHAFRTFHLSRGRLRPDGVLDGWLCGRAPVSLHDLLRVMYDRTMLQQPQRRLTSEEHRHFSSVRLETDPERPAGFCFLSYTCFVSYVPQALGVAAARWLGGSVLAGFYGGRLANLLFCVLALHLALRLLPFYKNLLGAVALLPITVQQCSTLSADAMGIAVCFVFTALALRLLAPGGRPGTLHLLGLCGTALLLPLCKIPYAFLTLLYLAVPPARLGSLRRYLLAGAALTAMTVLGVYITLRTSKGATRLGEGSPSPEVSRSRQAEYIRQHPLHFARALSHTTICWGWVYCENLTTLGWLNVPLHHIPAKAYLLFLVLMAVVDRRQGWAPGLRPRVIALGLCLLVYTAFQAMLYLVWTPLACPLIDGFQGRYFVGLLPVLFLLCYSRAITVRASPPGLLALTAAAATGVQLAAVHAVLCAYYFVPQPTRPQPYLPLLLVIDGLLFLTALFVVAKGKRPADASDEHATGCELPRAA